MLIVQFQVSQCARSFLPPCVESRRTNTKWRSSKYESRHNKYHISGLLSFSGAKLLPPYIEINAATSAKITRTPPAAALCKTEVLSITIPPMNEPKAIPKCRAELFRLCCTSDVSGALSIK